MYISLVKSLLTIGIIFFVGVFCRRLWSVGLSNTAPLFQFSEQSWTSRPAARRTELKALLHALA